MAKRATARKAKPAPRKAAQPAYDDIEELDDELDQAADDGEAISAATDDEVDELEAEDGQIGGVVLTRSRPTPREAAYERPAANKSNGTNLTHVRVHNQTGDGKTYDIIMYHPGHQDPAWTKTNGIEFKANVPVKVPRTKTVEQLLRHEQPLADGQIVSRAITTRVPMFRALEGNHCFSINGLRPKRPGSTGVRLPANAEAYRSYAIEWIAKTHSLSELDARWASEQALRDRISVDQRDMQHIMPFLQARQDDLRERAEPAYIDD